MNIKSSWNIINLIRIQTCDGLMISPSPYVILFLGLALTQVLLANSLKTVNDGYLSVLNEPFLLPLNSFCLLSGLSIALLATISISKEREQGLVETLYYGPVNPEHYLFGKLLAHLFAYGALISAYIVAALLFSKLTNLSFSPRLLLIAVFSIFTATAFISLGLFISAVVKKIRNAVLIFLGVILIFLALQLGEVLLTSIVVNNEIMGLVFLRDTLAGLNKVLDWLSPPFYLLSGSNAMMRQNLGETALYLGAACVFSIILFALSANLLRRNRTGI